MKPEQPSPYKPGAGRKKRRSAGTGPLPVEWMDPMSWRLPSGKALAEFALQAGFLAPLILKAPKVQKKKTAPEDTRVEEVPERSGTFRETR